MRVWSESKQRAVKKNTPKRAAMLAERRQKQRNLIPSYILDPTSIPWHITSKYVPAGEHKKLVGPNLW